LVLDWWDKMKREELILAIVGGVASIGVTFLFYRMSQQSAAQDAANSANAAAEQESELANEQSEIASLPSISVPTVSSTPSSTDVAQQTTGTSASDSTLEAIVSAMQATSTNSAVTTTITPLAAVGLLTAQGSAVTAQITPTTVASVSPAVNTSNSNVTAPLITVTGAS
jgi:hypothetical protein